MVRTLQGSRAFFDWSDLGIGNALGLPSAKDFRARSNPSEHDGNKSPEQWASATKVDPPLKDSKGAPATRRCCRKPARLGTRLSARTPSVGINSDST